MFGRLGRVLGVLPLSVSAAALVGASGCSKPASSANGEGSRCRFVCLQSMVTGSMVEKVI